MWDSCFIARSSEEYGYGAPPGVGSTEKWPRGSRRAAGQRQKRFLGFVWPVQMAKLDLQWTGMAGVERRRPDYEADDTVSGINPNAIRLGNALRAGSVGYHLLRWSHIRNGTPKTPEFRKSRFLARWASLLSKRQNNLADDSRQDRYYQCARW